MGEGHIQKFVRSLKLRIVLWLSAIGLITVFGQWLIDHFTDLNSIITVLFLAVMCLCLTIPIGLFLGDSLAKPTEYLAQAILHISPAEHLVAAPNTDRLKFGRELVESLTRQIYSFSTSADHQLTPPGNEALQTNLVNQLPISIIGLDEKGVINLVNQKLQALMPTTELSGQPLKDSLQLLTDDETLIEAWLENARQKSLTDTHSWQKVELKLVDNTSLGYFDVAISFSKHSSSGIDAVIALYDHSDAYDDEVSSISFVALAVHEMRTPLTILRGYIEAFKEELGDNIPPQINADLQKMNASADSLTSFVSNILNVARINQGQLTLELHESDWNSVLPEIVDNLRNRAAVYGKQIELRMQPGLPKAAIERATIGEVITNLIDNAIKYSPDKADKIMVVSRLNGEGQIETTVRDQGVGIPASVMPHLFSKFQRNHRNRAQIGGTGLGLFLCKSIVTAHHGNIWAQSKENEGSTFGFTLLPYDQLAKDLQTNNNEAIVRKPHGWIKNHSMQRH